MDKNSDTGYRVSPPRIFGDATRSPKPALGSVSADAYRQSNFLLSEEIDLFLRGLNLESSIALVFSGSKYRNQDIASLLVNWSRSWLARLQALHSLENGNYSAAFPLVRASIDHAATQSALIKNGARDWTNWLEGEGIRNDNEAHAVSIGLGRFRSGEFLASEHELGLIYRVVSDFTLPHFGSTLLVAGGEPSEGRVAPTFADRDFHLAFSEIIIGWLLKIGISSFSLIESADEKYQHPHIDLIKEWIGEAERLLGDKKKSFIHYDGQNYVLENWRRSPTARAKRVILRLESG